MTPEHRAERRQCITGTDIPRLLGVYFDGERGPANVYADKLGLPTDSEDLLIMRRGRHDEPFALAEFVSATGQRIVEVPGVSFHADDSWIGASLDAETYPGGEPVDAKCIFGFPGDEWGPTGSDNVPPKVLLQSVWQCHVRNSPIGFVAALFPYEFRWYRIGADPELVGLLVEIAAEFLLRVRERRGVDDWQHSLIPKALARCQRVAPGKSVTLPFECGKVAADYVGLGKFIREAEERRDEAKGILLEAMGDAEIGTLPDGSVCRRRVVERKGYSVPPSSYVDFRIIGGKAKSLPAAKPYALPDMSEAESAERWLELEGASIEAAIAAIGQVDAGNG